jgi:hypothetical protein
MIMRQRAISSGRKAQHSKGHSFAPLQNAFGESGDFAVFTEGAQSGGKVFVFYEPQPGQCLTAGFAGGRDDVI